MQLLAVKVTDKRGEAVYTSSKYRRRKRIIERMTIRSSTGLSEVYLEKSIYIRARLLEDLPPLPPNHQMGYALRNYSGLVRKRSYVRKRAYRGKDVCNYHIQTGSSVHIRGRKVFLVSQVIRYHFESKPFQP